MFSDYSKPTIKALSLHLLIRDKQSETHTGGERENVGWAASLWLATGWEPGGNKDRETERERERDRSINDLSVAAFTLPQRKREHTLSIIEFLNQLPWIMALRLKGSRSRFSSSLFLIPPSTLRFHRFQHAGDWKCHECLWLFLITENHSPLSLSQWPECCHGLWVVALPWAAVINISAADWGILHERAVPASWRMELQGPWSAGDEGEVIFRQITMAHLQIGLWMRANQAERHRDGEWQEVESRLGGKMGLEWKIKLLCYTVNMVTNKGSTTECLIGIIKQNKIWHLY